MPAPRFKLSLFVTPDSSGRALEHLYKALSVLAYNDYQLEIVDVLKEPERAKQADIIGTPTLVYHAADGNKVVSTLSDAALIRRILEIAE